MPTADSTAPRFTFCAERLALSLGCLDAGLPASPCTQRSHITSAACCLLPAVCCERSRNPPPPPPPPNMVLLHGIAPACVERSDRLLYVISSQFCE